MSEALGANRRRAAEYLARFQSGAVPHFIAGAPQPSRSGATFETLDPTNNQRQATVASGDAMDIDAAAQTAAATFPAWRAIAGDKRRAILHAIADAIEARAEEIALVESSDTGQPIRYMSKAALRGAENFRFYADRAPGADDGRALPNERPPQLLDPAADRPRRRHHAMEHAVHAVDLEDRASARGRLYGRAQAGGMEPALGGDPHRDHGRDDPPPRRPGRRRQSRSWLGRDRRQER